MVVFLCLLAVLGAVTGGAIWAGQTDDEPLPATPAASPEPSEDHTLTDAEAIARFKELDALRIRAFETRNPNLLADVFVPMTTDAARAESTIARLRKDDVLMTHKPYRNREISIVQNEPNHIEIEQQVVFHIKFSDESGRDVTREGEPELLTVRWTLERVGRGWFIAAGKVIGARPYRRK